MKQSKLPADVSFFGGSFTVLSYDSATDRARIRWNSGFSEGEYSITRTTPSRPIHVYVPR